MTDTEYIETLKETIRLETERADRNYAVAEHFERLYEEAMDWFDTLKLDDEDVE